MEQLLLGVGCVMLVAAAVLVVVTDKLLKAVFYSGVFSLLAAFCFVLLGAPDVALAEAVVGSAISTVLYLAALRGYKLLTVYLIHSPQGGDQAREALRVVERALKGQELELHIIEGGQGPPPETTADFLIIEDESGAVIQGPEGSVYLDAVRQKLEWADPRAGIGIRAAVGQEQEGRLP